jgi:serine protease
VRFAVSLLALSGCERLFGGAPANQTEPLGSFQADGRWLERPPIDAAAQSDDATWHLPEVVVVDFVDGTTKAEFDAIEQAWGLDLELADEEEGVDSAITVGTYQGDVEALLSRIRQNEQVEVAEPLMRFAASFVPNDPAFSQQWNFKMINMPKAWDRSKGKGVVVAVLDTGIAYENYDDFRQVADLRGTRFVEGYDFVNKDRHANDDHGHGTHVAGTIAQATNNGEGVAGVAFEASLMPVKVLDHFGGGTSADIADAIRWAADHGAHVINMSLGGGGRSVVMERAVAYARKKGVVVVCAAGNGGRGVVEYPAAYPASVAVGAVGPSGQRAPYSSWGKELDLAAPGGDKTQGEGAGVVQNTIDPQDVSRSIYASYQGTSMATPHVAGVAALLFAAGAKDPDQVEKALFASAHPPKGMTGWSDQYGFGVVDAEAALVALKKSSSDEVAAVTQDVRVFEYAPMNWKPFAFGAALLAFVLLTLGRKERPGYLNVFVSPGFLLPLALTTLGAFFVRWVSPASELTTAWTLPIPDWLNDIIFGRGSVANPLVYSALVPTVLAIAAIKLKSLRQMAGGVALGFAGILAYTIWAKAPGLAWLPFTFLAIPWLLANVLVCLFVARALLKREAP